MKLKDAESEFNVMLTDHLKRYYVETLGLRDFKSRLAYRVTEEKVEEARLLNLLNKLNIRAPSIKMLVVGSGWGGYALCS